MKLFPWILHVLIPVLKHIRVSMNGKISLLRFWPNKWDWCSKIAMGPFRCFMQTDTRTELLQTGTEPCLSFQTIPVKNHKDLVFESIFPNFDPVWDKTLRAFMKFADYWYLIQDVIKPVEKKLWSRNIVNVDSHLK